MTNNRHVRFDMDSLGDGVQPPQPSGNHIPPPPYHSLGRIIRDPGTRGSDCECQKHLMNDPIDSWAGQLKIPARTKSLMEMTNMKSLNYESLLQFGRINNSDAIVAHEAATEAAIEEAFRVKSEEEFSNAINASVGFTDFGFSLEIEESRTTKQFTTTETTKRRIIKETYSAPSQLAIHVYKKVDTVELQTWFEGEDCYVTTADAGIFCGNIRRGTHRS